MDRDRIKRIIIFVIILVIIILFISLLKKKVVPDNDSIEKESSEIVDRSRTIYKSGDKVLLKDNTEWFVLFDSKNTEKYVTLFSKDNINISNLQDDKIVSYLNKSYMDQLIFSNHITMNDVQEVRMLTLLDISKVLGVSTETLLKKYDIKKYEMFKNDTLVNYYKDNTFYSICDNNVCKSDNRNIRVVVTIDKYFVKKTS